MNVFGSSLEGERNLIISRLETSLKNIESDVSTFKHSTQRNIKTLEENHNKLISKLSARIDILEIKEK